MICQNQKKEKYSFHLSLSLNYLNNYACEHYDVRSMFVCVNILSSFILGISINESIIKLLGSI